MKRFDYPLDRHQMVRLLSSFRHKKDIIVLWMNVIKTLTSYVEPGEGTASGHLVLHVDKMSRLFVEAGTKSFSTVFPFSIYEREDGLEFGSAACPLVDSKVTSDVLALVNGHDILSASNVLEFADPLMDIAGDQNMVWELFRDLMICDDGYIRIDHDPVNQNGNLHPLDHVDVFYSQSATFKMGLSGRASMEDFHDILNIKSDCHFLRPL